MRTGIWARGVLAVLACLAWASAAAQSFGPAIEQARAGLDRAVKLPLEIIWLQSEIAAEMWRTPALAHALQGCAQPGAPREGCAVSVRSAWRYSFDADAAVRPAPIVISSLAVAGAPFARGRLNLSGSGRVFLVTSDAKGGAPVQAPAGVVLLAAGSTVQLVDAAYPSIQIEVRAPEHQPLFLGNLAAAEIGRIFALLVPRRAQSATAADVLQRGRVALRAREPATELALAAPAPSVEAQPRMPVALAERMDVAMSPAPQAAPILVLDTMPVAHAERLDVALAPTPQAEPILVLDSMPVAVAESRATPEAKPEPASKLLVLEGMPAAVRDPLAREPIVVAEAREILVLESMPAAVQAPVEKPAPRRSEIVVASVPAPGATPALSPELAKLRAEVEAEIARDNARMAQALQERGAKHFRFGT